MELLTGKDRSGTTTPAFSSMAAAAARCSLGEVKGEPSFQEVSDRSSERLCIGMAM